jgi:hypothetical protein
MEPLLTWPQAWALFATALLLGSYLTELEVADAFRR